MDTEEFRNSVLSYYRGHRRAMPWRDFITPYRVVVSEFMLQQTQVDRVTGHFERFVAAFPDFEALSSAPVNEILSLWQGLGYNRRALYLGETARILIREYGGIVPAEPAVLSKLPGIGLATASAIIVYAYDKPLAYVETNIRTVYIHHFFSDMERVTDAEILKLVDLTMDRDKPREWFYALMDYGTYLKKSVGNLSRKSVGYGKAAGFKGSKREVRGAVLKILLAAGNGLKRDLAEKAAVLLGRKDERFDEVLSDLVEEGFVSENEGIYSVRTDSGK